MLLIKLYSAQFDTTPDRQIEDIQSMSIKYDINSFGIAEFTLPLAISGLKQFQKVEIYTVDDTDTLLFTGFIYNLRVDTSEIKITCRSEKALLYKKILLTDKSFSGTSISSAINSILSEWNTAYSENWTLETDLVTTITKEFKQGDNFFDVIEEIAGLAEAVFDVSGNVIMVKELLGEDKTTGASFTEIIYNGQNPEEDNIINIELESYETISNVIIGSDSTNKNTQTDPTSITEFGALGQFISFREGDLTNQTVKYLASKKLEQKLYQIEVEPNAINANLGDKIKLRIESVNDYMDYEGDVIVNTKDLSFVNDTKIEKYGVSSIYVWRDNLSGKLNKITRDLNLKFLT